MITLITCVQYVNVLNSKLWYIKLWSSLRDYVIRESEYIMDL